MFSSNTSAGSSFRVSRGAVPFRFESLNFLRKRTTLLVIKIFEVMHGLLALVFFLAFEINHLLDGAHQNTQGLDAPLIGEFWALGPECDYRLQCEWAPQTSMVNVAGLPAMVSVRSLFRGASPLPYCNAVLPTLSETNGSSG